MGIWRDKYNKSILLLLNKVNPRRERVDRIACWGDREQSGQCESGRLKPSQSPPRHLHHWLGDSIVPCKLIASQRTLNSQTHPAQSSQGDGQDGGYDTGKKPYDSIWCDISCIKYLLFSLCDWLISIILHSYLPSSIQRANSLECGHLVSLGFVMVVLSIAWFTRGIVTGLLRAFSTQAVEFIRDRTAHWNYLYVKNVY